jgi:hypothetical protein
MDSFFLFPGGYVDIYSFSNRQKNPTGLKVPLPISEAILRYVFVTAPRVAKRGLTFQEKMRILARYGAGLI